MRALFLVLLGALAAAALWIATTRGDAPPPEPVGIPRALPREAAPDERLVVLDVAGMCCDDCPKSIHARLAAAPGVRAAAVDRHAGTAAVLCAASADVDAIAAAATFDAYVATPRP